MRRRDFVTLLGGTAAWPLAAHAQQASIPVIAFVSGRSADGSVSVAAAFRKGLNETGYAEGQNVTVEYHWLEGQYDRLPAVFADLVHRRVAVIDRRSRQYPCCACGQSCDHDDPYRFRRW